MEEKKPYLMLTFKNMKKCVWQSEEFTDYNYDGKCIVIKKDDQLVAVYPIDSLIGFVFFD